MPQPRVSLVGTGPLEMEKTLTEVFRNAQSEVKLFSSRLENREYGQSSTMEQANLFLCTQETSLKILMSAEEHGKYLYHPLFDLQKKHANRSELRVMDEKLASGCKWEFLVADRHSYFFRKDIDSMGVTTDEDLKTAAHLDGLFDQLWEMSHAPT